MKFIAPFIIRHRRGVLAVLGILTVWFAFQAARIQVDTDVLNFYPENDPDVRFFKETGGKFGSNYVNFVAVEGENIFTHKTLSTLRELTKGIERISGVKQVLSLTNVLDMRRKGSTLEVAGLINPESIPKDPNELARLRDYTLENPLLVGSLISTDGRASLISVRIEENADREQVVQKVRSFTTRQAEGSGLKLYFGGFTMVMDYMGDLLARDMGRLIPITFLFILLTLYVSFGCLRGVVLPMGAVLLSIIWTLGAMSFLGLALSILTSVIPIVIMAIGTVSGIYVLVRYYEETTEIDPARKTETTLAAVISPVAVAGLTMVLGFLSLTVAPLPIFKEFGVAAGLGAFVSMALSATFLPAVLAMLPHKAPRPFALATPANSGVRSVLQGISGLVTRHPTGVLVFSIAACLAAGLLYPKVPRNVNLLSYFPKDSEPQEAEYILKKHFGGSQLFIVNFHANDVREPAVLEKMDLLGKRLRTIPNVNLPQSPADLVKMLNRLLNDEPGIPDSLDKVTNLWLLLEGQPSVGMFVENNFTNGVVQARIGDMDTAVVAEALERIQQAVKQTGTGDLVLIAFNELSPQARQKALRVLAGSIAENAALDVAFHMKKDIPAIEELAGILVSALEKSLSIDDADRHALEKSLIAYFGSDECDISLGDGADPAAIAGQLAGSDLSDRKSILSSLKEALPAGAWKNDEEGLDYAAEAVETRLFQYLQQKRHQEALAGILNHFEIDGRAPANKLLVDDLASDAWAINHETFAVTLNAYKEITGEKAPGENRMAIQTRLTGFPPTAAKFEARLVGTQVKSVILAMITILIVLGVYYRSAVGGLIATTPIAFTVLMLFGAMGLFAIPLDNTTIMISSIAMGVGVGYAIHFLERLRMELAEGADFVDGLRATILAKGRAVLINTLAISIGFAVLAFSVMTPQRRFGLLIALTMWLAAGGTFTLLPAILLKYKPGFLRK